MSIENRKELKKDIEKIKTNRLELGFLDKMKGNFEKKYSLLKKSLFDIINENIRLEEKKERLLKEIGNIEEYNDFLDKEMKVKLFDNLRLYPSLVNHRVQARAMIDTEVNQVMSVLENKPVKVLNSIYFTTIENLKNINNGKELLNYLKKLIEIETNYADIFKYENEMLYKIAFNNPVIDFNKGNLSLEVLEDVYNFLENGFGIASLINFRNNKITELEKKVQEITFNKEKTRD